MPRRVSDLRDAAIREDFAARDEAAFVRGEERNDFGDFLIATRSSERSDARSEIKEAAQLVCGSARLFVTRGDDNAGTHCVNPDIPSFEV